MPKIDEIIATLRGHVCEELGEDATFFVSPRGFVVEIPARQRFEAETLDEAINMARSWKEMMTRA